ncbi:hypothetical protein BDP55DRAFT_409834 [Colletotrichum godetiae]|uniref:Secreted protein n=1 Tax=Colletotrichum godetiae TaxID=1209918 RepID=A0AAJ0ASC6_9PEZI|nr:uncharacterized protein BDP55DRAFT_409834 [Colletotrichum godetiae]KAK1689490.1 hypothetical protein BDP55DRAFT_409834 [Colletotrichum godetiae]
MVRILFVATHLVRVAGFKTLFAQSRERTVRPFRSQAGGGGVSLEKPVLGFLESFGLGRRRGVVRGVSGCLGVAPSFPHQVTWRE